MTCLHYACKNGHLEVVKFILMKGSVNINAASCVPQEKGLYLTPLDLTLSNNHSDIAKYLESRGGLTMEKIIRISATRIQALYRSYRIRKSFMEHRELLLKHERLLKRQKNAKIGKTDNKVVQNAGSFLGHVVEETHITQAELNSE